MKALIDKETYIKHAIGVLFVLMAVADITQNKIVLIIMAMVSFSAFVFSFPFKNKNYFTESILFILFLLAMSIVNLFFTQNNFGGSLTFLGNIVLALLYIQFADRKLTVWVVAAYLITLGFMSFHLFVLGTHENLIYPGLSRNHAGFAVVFWSVVLLFHLKVHHNIILLGPPVLALILAFFLVGRTSLIVSAILVLVCFYYKFKNSRKILGFATLIGIVSLYFLWIRFGQGLLSETNLESGLDTPRWELWRIYWDHLDFVNIFTGVDVMNLPVYGTYSGNPHNSFIKFHSRVGVGSLVFVLLLCYSSFKYLQNRNYYIFLLLMLLILRAMFDGDMLLGNFDFIFFIITFYWIKTE